LGAGWLGGAVLPSILELKAIKRGIYMHEVKVFDSSGRLKKIISIKSLNKRSIKQLESPALFLSNKRDKKSLSKSQNTQSKRSKL